MELPGDRSYRVRGAYLESCNCEAICPCRMIGGTPGGRSTYGICYGLLSWAISAGEVDGVDVGGLAVALAFTYSDDEPGSPWTLTLHVDERGDEEQREALEWLFLEGLHEMPWIRKMRHVVGTRASAIEVDRGTVRVGSTATMRATRPVATDEPVACGIPGYERGGEERYADELTVHDAPFDWELQGNCAFASNFDYAST